MESVLELKGKLQNVYAQYSTYIDKVVRICTGVCGSSL